MPGQVSRRARVLIASAAAAMLVFVLGAVAADGALPSCADAAWGCEFVHDPPGIAGSNTAIAFDPSSGVAWVSFRDQDAQALMVAHYVGLDGNGNCEQNTAWECVVVDDPEGHDVGFETDIAFTPEGTAWVSYQDTTTDDLKVAHTLQSGGSGCAPAVTSWSCEVVDAASQVGGYSAIAIEHDASSGTSTPLVTYWDSGNDDLRWAHHTNGGAGAACDAGGWDCGVVDSGSVGAYANDLAVDSSGRAWAAYRHSGSGSGPRAARLVVATHVDDGSGTGCGDGSPEWTCVQVAKTGNVGLDTGIAFDPDGMPWVHYWNNQNLNLARLDLGGTASRCDLATDWECTTVHDVSDNVGEYGGIAFDGDGSAWIAYHGATAKHAYVAHHVGAGSGGGCGAGGSSGWACSTLDASNDVGAYWMGIATDPTGKPWVSYFDRGNGALKVAVAQGSSGPPPPPPPDPGQAPVIDGFSPTSGKVLTVVTISGSNLAGATEVSFNGTAVLPDDTDEQGTWITATVPIGAKTGPITVTTPAGSATSTQSFRVTKR